jgi:poly(A) polymerase
MTEREFAIGVVRRLQEAGHEALWAGGCVRDELLSLVPKDYDVATNARPEQVQNLFRRALAVGASFGVIEVLGPRQEGRHLSVEVATFRTDGTYSDGRRPDEVVFSSAREDAQRRDFTINGMFFDPLQGRLIDYVGGQADLHARILRAIGDAGKRFEEDKLRLLRAVRLATRFELTIEPATEAAIKTHAATINVVSAERIAEELRQLLVHPRRSQGVKLLGRLHLLEPLLPELASLQGGRWEHVLTVLEYLGPEPSFSLALAGLLHELGKAHVVQDICLRLRLSNQERERAVWLVERLRSLDEIGRLRTCRIKQLLAEPGIHELLALYRADALADGRSAEPVEHCEALLRQWTKDDLDPAPFITGQDLIDLGLKPGPKFKEILDMVRDAQLDGDVRSREEALALVK